MVVAINWFSLYSNCAHGDNKHLCFVITVEPSMLIVTCIYMERILAVLVVSKKFKYFALLLIKTHDNWMKVLRIEL